MYFSLPPGLRQEVLHSEVTERRRRASFDETQTAQALNSIASNDASASNQSTASSSSVIDAPSVDASTSTSHVSTMDISFDSIFASAGLSAAVQSLPAPSSAPAPASVPSEPVSTSVSTYELGENARFLASLPFDLRQDVLLSADSTFLASLPTAAQAEARAMRSVHEGRVSAMASLMEGTEGNPPLDPNGQAARRYSRASENYPHMLGQVRAFSVPHSSRRHERYSLLFIPLISSSFPLCSHIFIFFQPHFVTLFFFDFLHPSLSPFLVFTHHHDYTFFSHTDNAQP